MYVYIYTEHWKSWSHTLFQSNTKAHSSFSLFFCIYNSLRLWWETVPFSPFVCLLVSSPPCAAHRSLSLLLHGTCGWPPRHSGHTWARFLLWIDLFLILLRPDTPIEGTKSPHVPGHGCYLLLTYLMALGLKCSRTGGKGRGGRPESAAHN